MSTTDKTQVIEEFLAGRLTRNEACLKLGVHRTTLWRLCRRFQEKGSEGLVHGLKGRRSNRAKPEAMRQELVARFATEGQPRGKSVFSFYDRVARGLPDYVSYSTLLGWLREAGLLGEPDPKKGQS
ncbi:MAG TPA: helix-turn-helix domain-containing protein [bacterium]|nr:helix-turn-helix domain-containing protein [bacterium]